MYGAFLLQRNRLQALCKGCFFNAEKGETMVRLIILLYALNGMFGGVPAGCFIAAWVCWGVAAVLKIIEAILKAAKE